MRLNSLVSAIGLVLAAGVSGQASAQSFNFYDYTLAPTSGGVGCPQTGATTPYNFFWCQAGAGGMVFTSGSLSVSATGSLAAGGAVTADKDPSAGLGVFGTVPVGTATTTAFWWGDDNIQAGEILTLTFSQTTSVGGIGVNSAAGSGHGTSVAGDTYLLSVNGGSWMQETVGGSLDTFNLSGVNTLAFQYGGSNAQQFYVGQVVAVPEPETYALMLAGLAAVGFVARRRAGK